MEIKRNLIVRITKVGNMPTGTRFLSGENSTLVIATNSYMVIDNVRHRMCVSESGVAKWVDCEDTLPKFDKTIKLSFTGLSHKIIKEYMNFTVKRDDSITLDTKISDDSVYKILGTKAHNILNEYMSSLRSDQIKMNYHEATLRVVAENMDFDRIRRFYQCGDKTVVKITSLLKLADKNSEIPI